MVTTGKTRERKKNIGSLLKPVSAEITYGNKIVEPTKQTNPIFFTNDTALSFINKKAAII